MTELGNIYADIGIVGFLLVTIVLVFIFMIKKQSKSYDELLKKVLSQHTIEKDIELSRVEEEIELTLKNLIRSTDSARAFLIRFHNGGHDLTGVSFLKMSMTNEIVRTGIAPLQPHFKDQFRSSFHWWVNELSKCNVLHLKNTDELKEVDFAMYTFFKERGVKSAHSIALRDKDNNIVGFVGVEYMKDIDISNEQIEHCLRDKTLKIETILSFEKKER